MTDVFLDKDAAEMALVTIAGKIASVAVLEFKQYNKEAQSKMEEISKIVKISDEETLAFPVPEFTSTELYQNMFACALEEARALSFDTFSPSSTTRAAADFVEVCAFSENTWRDIMRACIRNRPMTLEKRYLFLKDIVKEKEIKSNRYQAAPTKTTEEKLALDQLKDTAQKIYDWKVSDQVKLNEAMPIAEQLIKTLITRIQGLTEKNPLSEPPRRGKKP